tara:strand:- start:82 stop:408 length:327 start_codon:yes stop_codon:yes gene_type:complete
MSKILTNNGVVREATAEEQALIDERETKYTLNKSKRKLSKIRHIRNQKLIETDYLSNSDVTMPDYIKTWRQTLRDLPQNNTTESSYDTLLERNADGSLKHSVWTKPTS